MVEGDLTSRLLCICASQDFLALGEEGEGGCPFLYFLSHKPDHQA